MKPLLKHLKTSLLFRITIYFLILLFLLMMFIPNGLLSRRDRGTDAIQLRTFESNSRLSIGIIETFINENNAFPQRLDFFDDLFEDLEEASFELLQLSETTLVFISTFRGEIFTRVFEILPDGSVDVREK